MNTEVELPRVKPELEIESGNHLLRSGIDEVAATVSDLRRMVFQVGKGFLIGIAVFGTMSLLYTGLRRGRKTRLRMVH